MSNPVTQFVLDTLERAAKTAAQVALLAFGTEKLNILHTDWTTIGGLAGGGFVLSILTSIASQPVGNKTSASLLRGTSAPAALDSAPLDPVSEAAKIFPAS